MGKQVNILKYLKEIADVIQVPLYWFDVNNVVLGGNKSIVKAIGGTTIDNFIGKTPYDYYPYEMADNLVKANNEIIKTGKIIIHEEPIKDISTGKTEYFTALKAPLRDDDGNIIGVIGTSINITAEKEAECLKFENERQKIKLEEQIKFKKLVDQAADDIKSPLATLLILVQQCSGLAKNDVFKTIEKLAVAIPVNISWFNGNGVVLGLNKCAVKVVGGLSASQFIGKNIYDLFPFEMADGIVKHNNLVMKTGKILSHEDRNRDFTTGETKYFTVFRAPLYDNNGEIIGILVTSADITTEKNAKRLKIESERYKAKLEEQKKFKRLVDQAAQDTKSKLATLLALIQHCDGLPKDDAYEVIERLASDAPIGIYWLDENNKILWSNKYRMKSTGLSIKDFIGKTLYDFYPAEIADVMIEHNNEVMRTGKILSYEEQVKDITTGEIKYFAASKAPIYDNNGKNIGTLGASVDITIEKSTHLLKAENELQKIKLQEQERFSELASGVSHDIRSPMMSLNLFVHNHKHLFPEKERTTLTDIYTRINDIANNLLQSNRKADAEAFTEIKEPQPVLVSLALSMIVSEKRDQYFNTVVEINDFCEPDSTLVFIKTDPSNFARMISNLVNNAVDAFYGENKKGIVNLNLSVKDEEVKIIIQDNGKGMPQKVIDKVMNNMAVTEGKENGNGIGLTQVRGTLHISKGKMSIESEMGKGTKIILTFPKINPPSWIASKIALHKGDIIIVLDDDPSIHGAWDMRFKDYEDDICVEHFKLGKEAVEFINKFSDKQQLFLLSDFELLNQDLDGLKVIEQTGMMQRAILVTSHYSRRNVVETATKNGIKILPKQLVPTVPIEIIATRSSRGDCL